MAPDSPGGERATAPRDGLSLGLLLMVALLLCGNLSALLSLGPIRTTEGPGGPAGPPAPPAPQRGPGAQVDEAFPEFQDLMLHDLVLALVALEEKGQLGLTRDQRKRLLALEPEVRDLFQRNVREPVALSATIGDYLTEEQRQRVYDWWRDSRETPPSELSILATRFRKALER